MAPVAFGKLCFRMSLCAIKRTIASALPKTNLAIAFGDPKVGFCCKRECKSTTILSNMQILQPYTCKL